MESTTPRHGHGQHTGTSQRPNSSLASLDIDRIKHNPYQPRRHFDDDELSKLKDSIQHHGVLQPLLVRKLGEEFQLIAGERRLRAAEQAGLHQVPVQLVEFNDQQVFEAALVENIQRADLNPIEKAQSFKDYIDRYQLTQDQLGAKLGLDRSTVSNLLGLLNLPAEVQNAVKQGQISMGHAKVLKGLNDPERQIALSKEVLLQGLSVHALESLVKLPKAPEGKAEKATAAAAPGHKTPHVESIENDLRQRLSCRVEIKVKAKEKGQIVIGFDNNDDFERILNVLNR